MRVNANPDIHLYSTVLQGHLCACSSAGLLTDVKTSFGDARFPLTPSIPLDVPRCGIFIDGNEIGMKRISNVNTEIETFSVLYCIPQKGPKEYQVVQYCRYL